MGWIEAILIIAGITLDIFGAMICQGSLVRNINKKQLAAVCFITGAGQLLALFLGSVLGKLAAHGYSADQDETLSEILAIIIFFGLAVKFFVKAFREDHFEEKLELRQSMTRYLKMTGLTAIYTGLAGIAFGLLNNTSIIMILIMVFVCSVIFVIAGMLVGYHFGFERKKQAFLIGGILLIIAGIDLIIRLAMHIL